MGVAAARPLLIQAPPSLTCTHPHSMVEHVRKLKSDCVIAYASWAKGKQFRPMGCCYRVICTANLNSKSESNNEQACIYIYKYCKRPRNPRWGFRADPGVYLQCYLLVLTVFFNRMSHYFQLHFLFVQLSLVLVWACQSSAKMPSH